VQWQKYSQAPAEIDWQWYGWPTLDTNDYVANFYMDDNPYWIWYDQDGNWVGTVETVAIANVPETVNKTVQTQYSGYTIESVNKENVKNKSAYEIKMKKGEDWVKILVDENGKVIKKKAKMDGTKTQVSS
jgi:hypothetical protein